MQLEARENQALKGTKDQPGSREYLGIMGQWVLKGRRGNQRPQCSSHRPRAVRVSVCENAPRHEKSKNVVSEQVRQKPSYMYTSTEDGYRLEIYLDLASRGIVLSVAKTTALICDFVIAYAKSLFFLLMSFSVTELVD